jgi:hypothetical protein
MAQAQRPDVGLTGINDTLLSELVQQTLGNLHEWSLSVSLVPNKARAVVESTL